MILPIILGIIVSVFTIFIGVRLAISPLLPYKDESTFSKDQTSLAALRDKGIITNYELEYIINLYKSKEIKTKLQKEFEKYEEVLINLKNIQYFSEKDFNERMDKLKECYRFEKDI